MSAKRIKVDIHSIKFRLWLYFLVFAIAVVVLIWYLQIFFLDNFYETMKTREVTRTATLISRAYRQGDENLTSNIQEISISNDFYVIVDSRSQLITFIPEAESRLPIYAYVSRAPELREMLTRSHGLPVSFKMQVGLEKYNTLAYGTVLDNTRGRAVYLYIFSPLYPITSTVNILKRQLQYVAIITMLLAFALAIYFATRISKPLKGISEAAREIGKGNYDVQLKTKSYSEINRLATTLNATAYELGMAETRRRDLIANVSHDLKTPLTMIRSYAEMIRDLSGDIPEKRNAHLNVIIDETERLTKLVNDLATISSLQTHRITLERSAFDLAEAAASILATYDILSEQEGYTFQFNAQRDCTVYADPVRIKQVIANLTSNAVKYCGEDKTVILTIRRQGKVCRLEVADHGPGISPEELPHVWDRYYKTSTNYVRPTEGTGLGLAIVKEILTLHQVEYGVESRVGKGSVFWFELPLARRERERDRGQRERTAHVPQAEAGGAEQVQPPATQSLATQPPSAESPSALAPGPQPAATLSSRLQPPAVQPASSPSSVEDADDGD